MEDREVSTVHHGTVQISQILISLCLTALDTAEDKCVTFTVPLLETLGFINLEIYTQLNKYFSQADVNILDYMQANGKWNSAFLHHN